MRPTPRIATCLLFFVLCFAWRQRPGASQTPAAGGTAQLPDGQHDFDFNLGSWRTHIRRLEHPLTGSSSWIQVEGTVVVRPIWNGRANLEELELDGPAGHVEGLTLRLYNPDARQWSLSWVSSKDGTLGTPMIGGFKDGRGEFLDQESWNGRMILVRQVYSKITPNTHHFEQSFSDDGGKTWEANWIADLSREAK
jgi:hypothetical protein